MPFVAIRMTVFDYLMHETRNPALNKLRSFFSSESGQGSSISYHKPNNSQILYNGLCGSMAGITAVSVCYPTDLLRRLMQLRGDSSEHNHKNSFEACKYIIKNQGVSGLYRGYQATIVKTVPMTALLFILNEQFRLYLRV
mmetsp:Transcript_9624/g.16166  ORF Transcript_9624/g.16166 Transcript_9624/m.16166 type:complete len:140 (+) Transcript_9624:573-992(+)